MKYITYNLEITGIVQGVGFRPFLYNLARNHDLRGVILNRGNAGV
ncbi:MAG: acylphosphatase, partial [Promethearchaeota archaeon]